MLIQSDHIIIIIIIGGMFSRIISGTLCLLIDITSLSSQSVNSTNPWANWNNCLLLEDRESFATYTAYLLAILLLLPLFILVLYVALQRWRSATTTTTAHMDVLTCHMVLLELLGVAGGCFYLYTSTRGNQQWDVAMRFLSFTGIGQSLFHLLACLDRYLAVVHPIRYMWMRQSAGIWLRNVSIGCAWLLCLSSCVVDLAIIRYYPFPILFSSVFVSSGTLCVLFAVSRSGPMRESGAKRRALHTVATITATLTMRFLTSLLPTILLVTLHLSQSQQCLLVMSSLTFSLPCSLVMPLLFLQRAGKLSNCQHTSRSESS